MKWVLNALNAVQGCTCSNGLRLVLQWPCNVLVLISSCLYFCQRKIVNFCGCAVCVTTAPIPVYCTAGTCTMYKLYTTGTGCRVLIRRLIRLLSIFIVHLAVAVCFCDVIMRLCCRCVNVALPAQSCFFCEY